MKRTLLIVLSALLLSCQNNGDNQPKEPGRCEYSNGLCADDHHRDEKTQKCHLSKIDDAEAATDTEDNTQNRELGWWLIWTILVLTFVPSQYPHEVGEKTPLPCTLSWFAIAVIEIVYFKILHQDIWFIQPHLYLWAGRTVLFLIFAFVMVAQTINTALMACELFFAKKNSYFPDDRWRRLLLIVVLALVVMLGLRLTQHLIHFLDVAIITLAIFLAIQTVAIFIRDEHPFLTMATFILSRVMLFVTLYGFLITLGHFFSKLIVILFGYDKINPFPF